MLTAAQPLVVTACEAEGKFTHKNVVRQARSHARISQSSAVIATDRGLKILGHTACLDLHQRSCETPNELLEAGGGLIFAASEGLACVAYCGSNTSLAPEPVALLNPRQPLPCKVACTALPPMH